MIGWLFCWQVDPPLLLSSLLKSLTILFNCPKVVQLSDLKFFKQPQYKPKTLPSSLTTIQTLLMSIQTHQHSSSILSKHQQSSSQLQQQVNDVLSCLTIMETYTEIEPTQINQSQQLLPQIEEPDDCQFLQNSQFKTTPFQASLSFIECKEEYQKENNNHNKLQPQQLSQDSSSSSSEQEQIIKKTTKYSPPRETLSILKRKKPAYPRTYNQHYKSKQDDTVCSTHYTPYNNSSPFNRNNKSTFIRSDSQNKRYNDRRFNKMRTDQDGNFSNHGNGYGGHQRIENRYEAKREEQYQQPQRNESYHNQQQQQLQPQHIEGNNYVANGENTYWGGYYPMQQLDWAQWNWYNRMKYYQYINTAPTVFPPQFQGFYPPSAVNFTTPNPIPPQQRTTEVHHTSPPKPTKETLSPEKKGKICNPKFQMTINQCQLIITCNKSTTSDILMIPYSVNQPPLYPYLKHQDYWLTRDKMDKILVQGKTRNGEISFLATDRSKVKYIAFLRVPSPKDQSFQTSFNRGLINLLTTSQPHGKSILIPYSFQFGSSKQKLNKIITFLQQDPNPTFTSLTINCQDMKSFRRMSDGANRCLSSLSQQHLIFY